MSHSFAINLNLLKYYLKVKQLETQLKQQETELKEQKEENKKLKNQLRSNHCSNQKLDVIDEDEDNDADDDEDENDEEYEDSDSDSVIIEESGYNDSSNPVDDDKDGEPVYKKRNLM